MIFKLPKIINEKYLIALFIAALFFLIIGFSAVYVEYSDRASPLIIHWDAFRGVDALGTASDLYEILAIALMALLVNLFLASAVFDRERFLSYVLAGAGLVFGILVSTAVLAIIKIN